VILGLHDLLRQAAPNRKRLQDAPVDIVNLMPDSIKLFHGFSNAQTKNPRRPWPPEPHFEQSLLRRRRLGVRRIFAAL
jgi:hypothetical protein